jgi:hypothetical protein
MKPEQLIFPLIINNMIIISTYFLHRNVHKETWQSPDGRTNNEIGRVLVDGRNESSITDVRSCRGADCDCDHHLVRINIERKYESKKKGSRQRK